MEAQVFIDWLRAERARRNLTQRDLAELSGIHHSTIAKVEQGISPPTADFVVGVAEAFDLTPKETLNWLHQIGVRKKPVDMGDAGDDFWIAECKRAVRGLPEQGIRIAMRAFKGACDGYRDAMATKGNK